MYEVGLARPRMSRTPWVMFGVHWNRALASPLRGASVYDATTVMPLSPSRMPLFLIPGEASRAGIGTDLKTWLPTTVSVNAKPVSWSCTTPAELTTWNCMFEITLPAVALGSSTVAVMSSEQEYWYLSNFTSLAGRSCAAEFQDCEPCPR